MRSTIVADFYRRSELVAAVKIGEYHLCHISNADFIDVMDGEGGYERELALVMCDAWPDPLDRKLLGPLLDFSFAWISENVAERKLLTHVADVLIGQTCPYYSLLLVKAYPSGDEEQDG